MVAAKPCEHNSLRQCKKCANAKHRKWAAANKQHLAEKSRLYAPKHAEKKNQRSRSYYQENREAIRKRVQAKRDSDPEAFRASTKGMKFDIQISDMVLQAGNRCEICRSGFKDGNDWNRVVDHVHHTKRVRGILCRRCNLMLGHAKDSIIVLEGAVAYLHRYGFMGES